MNNSLIEEAYDQAIRVLENCSHSLGLKASSNPDNGHTQIWARDSMVSLLGGALTKSQKIEDTLRASIDTLRKHQSSLGIIPNNVDSKQKGRVGYRAYADGGLWFVIGNAVFFEKSRDTSFLKKNYPAIKKTLNWYAHQDVDQSNLISIQEASDWQDLWAVRGKGLYVNILYYEALLKGSLIARAKGDNKQAEIYREKAIITKEYIHRRFWFTPEKCVLDYIRDGFGSLKIITCNNQEMRREHYAPRKTILVKDSYFLPYIAFRDFGEWFDSFANLLAIVCGVSDKTQTKNILNFIKDNRLVHPYPIRSIYPPILPGQKDWRYYYRYKKYNIPHSYHNGGIWPFIGGFYVAALVKAKQYTEAKKALNLLARLNKKGTQSKWGFNEWAEGRTGDPRGMTEQAWSAGMYLYGYECVKRKSTPFF